MQRLVVDPTGTLRGTSNPASKGHSAGFYGLGGRCIRSVRLLAGLHRRWRPHLHLPRETLIKSRAVRPSDFGPGRRRWGRRV